MKRKIKNKDGKIYEVDVSYVLKEGEEEVPETPEETPETPKTPETPETPAEETPEEEKAISKIKGMIEQKIESALKDIYANPVRKSPVFHKEDASLEKSVMETDPFLRSMRPFVKLSKKMEDFVSDIKSIVKGGIPKSLVKALNEGDDTEGGFLVPDEFKAEVIRYATEASVIRPRARIFPMTRLSLSLPKLDQSSNRFGGAAVYWTEESAAKTESEPAFGKITLQAKKLIGLVPASDEVLEDSIINLANYLVSLFGEIIGYEEDYRFIRGTGMGQPLGIIEAAGINLISRDTSSRILVDDILAMYVAHPAWADANSVWLATKAGMGELLKIGYGTTGGITLFMTNLRDAVTPVLMGKPIVLTEKLPALGLKGDLILADLKYYYIGDKGGIKVDSSIHDRFRYDETVLRFVKRVAGQPAIPSAFTVLIR